MYRNISHFANLTPLRFLAAALVVVFHVEETRKMFHAPNLTQYSLFAEGPLAVTFFFVLSGFLITYLLLREHESSGRIRVGRFYMRRIFRIWPLYFLLVLIGLVLIPAGVKAGRVQYTAPYEPTEVAIYFVLFLPMIVNLQYGNHFLTPLWSVGVEELYYLGWAPIVRLLRRMLLPILVGVVALKTCLAIGAYYVWQSELAFEVLRMLQLEAMAIGGLGAYFLFHCRRPIHEHWLFSKPVQTALTTLLLGHLFAHRQLAASLPMYATAFGHAIATPLLMMTLFAWFIVNAAINERSIIRLESPLLCYLGDISYGIYMYHALAISLVFVPFVDKFRAAPGWLATLVLHALVAALTLLMAALSKRYFEGRFLKYKRKFSYQAVPHQSAAPRVVQRAAA